MPLERLVQVIVDEEAHLHHLLILQRCQQIKQLGLHLLQRHYQVIDRVVLLSQVCRLGRVEHHVSQVDVPLH
jgi:hypothetical protein